MCIRDSDGAGKGASRPVGILVGDSCAVEPFDLLSIVKQIVGVADLMTPLAENAAAVFVENDCRRCLHILFRLNLQAGKNLCLRNIRPVSYTHLDVYKRQTLATANITPISEFE